MFCAGLESMGRSPRIIAFNHFVTFRAKDSRSNLAAKQTCTLHPIAFPAEGQGLGTRTGRGGAQKIAMMEMIEPDPPSDLTAVPMLDFSREFAEIRDEVMAAMAAVCESQRFIL